MSLRLRSARVIWVRPDLKHCRACRQSDGFGCHQKGHTGDYAMKPVRWRRLKLGRTLRRCHAASSVGSVRFGANATNAGFVIILLIPAFLALALTEPFLREFPYPRGRNPTDAETFEIFS